ncbi:PREDICTED: 39S ribosomal protein L2, mitochondrial [Corvus brachyrhynchos]|uniref:39S ribosomal protein L2, mitochondrial n=1 Tax=Corvus brachyrhynchos TaxID=85066 RepID=UPI0004DE0881|nr:PREDICTED: 39S ribosomal protein L2, mitochondrial [Corvus brachyrhynchos]
MDLYSEEDSAGGREETKGTRGDPSIELQQNARYQLGKTQGSLRLLTPPPRRIVSFTEAYQRFPQPTTFVSAKEGDAYPLGALPVGTLICNLESHPGKGAQYIRAAGTCGVLLRKVNGTAIVQLPSKRHMQVLETCVATVGRVSNVDHNKRVIGKAGRNRWLGKRPHTGLWHRKGGWAGRKIKPLPPMKSYVNLPQVKAVE